MSKDTSNAPSKVATSQRDPIWGIVWIFLGVGALWAGCTLIIYFSLPDWQARGTVGDSFGAVNALFAGLAFAGVLYSLNLQRQELKSQREEVAQARALNEAQLAEMRAARELSAQPLPMPKQCSFKIERPRLFYSPPEDEHSAHARYFAYTPLVNPTPFPAISVNVSAYLHFGEPRTILFSTDEHVSIAAPDHVSESAAPVPTFMFSGDIDGVLFDQLRQGDPRLVPAIDVVVLFKNTLGAHFRIVQSFQLYAEDDSVEALRSWHTAVAGFQAKYKRELSQMIELRRTHQLSEWGTLFAQVKFEFAASIARPEELDLQMYPIPASFSLETVSADDFAQGMKKASYAQVISSIYDCPTEIDSRRSQGGNNGDTPSVGK